ncbi:MAG TPA: MBL fold metallo-hydrolase [Gaiellaceae bacterium]|nr:MBL fold metallo-hydrolase [Gaiellaceae bacterium]
MSAPPRLTYVGGPTALLEWRGLRLLTDPTFDPAGTSYDLGAYTLRKTQGPALAAAELGRVDAVLLSHDHHRDNLDDAGRAALAGAGLVLTTREGAERLGAGATGLEPWEAVRLAAPDGTALTVTATPARHGPAGGDRGPVVGFALAFADAPGSTVWVSGDTVWYEGTAEVARHFPVRAALLNLGAARVAAAGPDALTLTAAGAVEAALAFPDALLVPLHFEGWEHFSEGRAEAERALAAAGLSGRVLWPPPGRAVELVP